MKEPSCTTRVRLTIEIDGSGPYGMNWTLANLVEQSRKETISNLQHKLADVRIRIVGEPVVLATVWEPVEKPA